jgi:DNA-binding beta-propeller fold protein YncE
MDKKNDYSIVLKNKSSLIFALLLIIVVTTLAFTGSAEAAGGWQWRFNLVSPEAKEPFQMPTAIYIEPEAGKFYVVESGKNSLHSFKFDGKFLNSFNPADALKEPFDMARVPGTEQLWVVEKGRNSLTKIDLKLKSLTPETLKYDGKTVYPDRLALVDNKFYVLDKSTGDIISYGIDLQPGTVFAGSGKGFVDFAVKNSELWALDGRSKKISRFDMKGKLKNEVSLGDQVSFPVAIEIGPSGFVYILDKHEGTIDVFDKSGDFKYSFLQKGHGVDSLYFPEDIVFDPLGRLCVVDTGNGRVGVFSR